LSSYETTSFLRTQVVHNKEEGRFTYVYFKLIGLRQWCS